jgi:PKD repeat protein
MFGIYEGVSIVVGQSSLTPSFTTPTTSGTAPLNVAFTDTTSGTVIAWHWNFGDGYTSTMQHPSHVYKQAGSYTVTLTVSNGNSSQTLVRPSYINVSAAPQSLTLRLNAPATVQVNNIFTVTVRLENATASQDIQGVIVNLKPGNLGMVTAVCNQPDTDQADNLIPYDSTTYPACQSTSSGYIVNRWLTSSQVISGSGSWVGLAFKATQEGCTDILLEQHQLVNSQAKLIPHEVVTTTVCALSNKQVLTGMVNLQSRQAGKYGNAKVNILNAQGTISQTVTDANGYFTFTNVALGDYTVRVRHPLFVMAERKINLIGTPNSLLIRSWAGDVDQSSNSNNCQKTVTLRDWYIIAASILPVNNPAFDINADGATDGRDMVILFNNIGKPNMCTTDAPDNYQRQADSMPTLIVSQAKLTWQSQGNGVMSLNISNVTTESIKSIGIRLEVPSGMTITSVTTHDKFASDDSFLNWYQQEEGNLVYITMATAEEEALETDALILTMETSNGDVQQIKMTDYNIVAIARSSESSNRIYLPLIAR